MPSIRMTLGAGVSALALSRNGVPAVSWPTAGGSGGTVTVTKHQPNILVAPASVGFTLDFSASTFDTPAPAGGVVYDRRMHEIHVFWTITGGTLPAWNKTQHYLTTAWQNPNIGIGPFLRRMLPAGTWTIEAYCVEPASGKTATATTSVTIQDASAYYGASNQIVVALDNVFTGAPAGTRVTSIVAAQAAWDAKTVPTRVLLKRGESYNTNGSNYLEAWLSTSSHFHLGAWGSGNRPIMTRTDGGSMVRTGAAPDYTGTAKDFRVESIDFRGGGDPTTESGVGVDEGGISVRSVSHLMVTDCLFSGLTSAVFQQGDTSVVHSQHVDNCSLTNHSSNGFYITDFKTVWGGWLAITGTHGVQNPSAIDSSDVASVASAFCRSTTPEWCLVEGNDLFQKTGPQGGTGVPHQPILRLGCSWIQDGSKTNMSRNVLEGGHYPVQFLFSFAGFLPSALQRAVRMNAVIDSNIFVPTYSTRYALNCQAGGMTARNNMMLVPGGLAYGSEYLRGMFYFDLDSDPDDQALDTPNKVYNNSLINLRTTAQNLGQSVAMVTAPVNYAGSVVENNVNHQPNINSPITTFGPIDTTTVLFTPWCIGAVPPPGGSVNTAYAPTSPVYLSAPLAGSPALGAALGGMTAEADIRGVARPTYPSAGAFEAGF
jgi:hypothetical protein